MQIHPGGSPIIIHAGQRLRQWFPRGAGNMQILLRLGETSWQRDWGWGVAGGLRLRRGKNKRASWQGGGAQRPRKQGEPREQAPALRTKR